MDQIIRRDKQVTGIQLFSWTVGKNNLIGPVLTCPTAHRHALLLRLELVAVPTTTAVDEGLTGGGVRVVEEHGEGAAAHSRLMTQTATIWQRCTIITNRVHGAEEQRHVQPTLTPVSSSGIFLKEGRMETPTANNGPLVPVLPVVWSL